MKHCILAILIFVPIRLFAADETSSLKEVLRKSTTSGEISNVLLADNLKSWPGLTTLGGVSALYDYWMNSAKGEEMIACEFIRKNLQIPPQEVVSFLLQRAGGTKDDTYRLMYYTEHFAPYSDDPRVTKYYASLLQDKRPLNRNRHPVEGAHTVRVCDIALKNLIKWFEKKGLLKWGDPGFVWDALHAEDFEKNIIAIQPYLIKTGVIADSKQSLVDRTNDLPVAVVLDANEALAGKAKAELTKQSKGNIGQYFSTRPWAVIFVMMVPVAGLLWMLVTRRK